MRLRPPGRPPSFSVGVQRSMNNCYRERVGHCSSIRLCAAAAPVAIPRQVIRHNREACSALLGEVCARCRCKFLFPPSGFRLDAKVTAFLKVFRRIFGNALLISETCREDELREYLRMRVEPTAWRMKGPGRTPPYPEQRSGCLAGLLVAAQLRIRSRRSSALGGSGGR